MHSDPQKTSRNAYRSISSYYNVGVFYADTGMSQIITPSEQAQTVHYKKYPAPPLMRNTDDSNKIETAI